MKITPAQLKVLLVDSNIISEELFDTIVKKAKQEDKDIDNVLVSEGLISDINIGQLTANFLRFNYVNLSAQKIPEEVLQIVPEVVARSRGVIAFAKDDISISLAMIDPDDLEIINFVYKRTGLIVKKFFITSMDLQTAVARYRSSAEEALKKILNEIVSPSLSKEEKEIGHTNLWSR